MSISNPVTPGLMSVVLGIVPVIAAWLYSEYLRYTKHSISAKAFVLLDESFLVENRLTLRAIIEFAVLMGYFYICDRTDVFNSSKKSFNRDLFLFLYFLLIIVSAITSFTIHNMTNQHSTGNLSCT
ncbi:protein REDUCED WALL ACETYLATION 2 [Brassica napus]|uniref:protein REDUCED WALL ACETYLATION 2 n=1 Tax=Brassica napus TaxID=3708 RepID=UPI0020784FEC|nr:protein REDUCED WALL ACETYLATION 2 [Brassica napus]